MHHVNPNLPIHPTLPFFLCLHISILCICVYIPAWNYYTVRHKQQEGDMSRKEKKRRLIKLSPNHLGPSSDISSKEVMLGKVKRGIV